MVYMVHEKKKKGEYSKRKRQLWEASGYDVYKMKSTYSAASIPAISTANFSKFKHISVFYGFERKPDQLQQYFLQLLFQVLNISKKKKCHFFS